MTQWVRINRQVNRIIGWILQKSQKEIQSYSESKEINTTKRDSVLVWVNENKWFGVSVLVSVFDLDMRDGGQSVRLRPLFGSYVFLRSLITSFVRVFGSYVILLLIDHTVHVGVWHMFGMHGCRCSHTILSTPNKHEPVSNNKRRSGTSPNQRK